MKKKTRQILAIIALVFCAIFTVGLILSLTLLNERTPKGYTIMITTLVSGLISVGLLFYLKNEIKKEAALEASQQDLNAERYKAEDDKPEIEASDKDA